MLRKAVLAAALLCAEFALAEYDQFYFSSNSTSPKCKDLPFPCELPSICAHESLTDTHYCCGTDSKDSVCWRNSQNCRGEDKKPATGQLGCPTNASPNGYCCLSDREKCTQRSGQINICWAVPQNPIANINGDLVRSRYSSLVAASPSASTLNIAINALLSTSSSAPATSSTASPSSSASSSGSSTPSTSPTSSTSPSPSPASPASISGGAIGGIVVGAIAGVAALGGGIFFILRRRRNKSASAASATAANHPSSSSAPGQHPTAEMDAVSFVGNPYLNNGHAYSAVAQSPNDTAKYAYHAEANGADGRWNQPVEMPTQAAQELDGGYASAPPSRNGAGSVK